MLPSVIKHIINDYKIQFERVESEIENCIQKYYEIEKYFRLNITYKYFRIYYTLYPTSLPIPPSPPYAPPTPHGAGRGGVRGGSKENTDRLP